ncbi:hypothetical protein AMTRI_Chr10g8650 [Amborella trichopoda]
MRPSTANPHLLSESVPESLATLVLPYSIITQDPFAILHSLPQFTALVLLGYSYFGKLLAKCSADSFPKLQILLRRWRIGVSFRLLAFPVNEDELQLQLIFNVWTELITYELFIVVITLTKSVKFFVGLPSSWTLKVAQVPEFSF